MRLERNDTKRKYWLAGLFLVMGTCAGVYHNRRVQAGKPDYVAGAVRGIVAAPARALSGIGGVFGRQTEWIRRGRRLADENRELRDEVERLRQQNRELSEAQINLDRLRFDLGFVREHRHALVPADVVGLRPDQRFDTMIINRGNEAGIRPNSVVITREGVVGRVFEVERGTASVLMITDQKSGIGARVQRPESRAVGVCEGSNGPTLSMIGLADTADVKVGDSIITSGLGGIYPAGLLIGFVSEIKPDLTNGGRIIRVKPDVNVDRLEQVYVIP